MPEKSEWQQIAEDLFQAYQCAASLLDLGEKHSDCGLCEAAVARFNKGNIMDREEWQKAMENANVYQKKTKAKWSDMQHKEYVIQDLEYWRKKYMDETVETMRLRRQIWDLRDKLGDLKDAIRDLLKKVDK